MWLRCGFLALFVTALAATAPDAQAQTAPQFEQAPCDLRGATPAVIARVRCGKVAVPRIPGDPASGVYRLAVMIIQDDSPLDPSVAVVNLAGGPGFPIIPPAISEADLARTAGFDTVLINPRGTLGSEPRVCPEAQLFDGTLMGPSYTTAELLARAAAIQGVCLKEASAMGVRPEEFGSGVNAEDVEYIRQALGYQRWNAIGGSYGAVTAIELANRYPASLRSLVLSSPALGGEVPSSLPDNARRAWRSLEAECANHEACARLSPGLSETAERTFLQLDSAPRPVAVPPQFKAPSDVAMLDRADLEIMLFFASYRRDGMQAAPLLLNAISAAPDEVVAGFFMNGFMAGGVLSPFVQAAVLCRDGGAAKWSRFSAGAASRHGYELIATPVEICGDWSSSRPLPAFPSSNAIPTLVLSGSLDPVTPPTYGVFVASRLGASATHIEFPGLGHVPQGQSACAEGIVVQFVRDPLAKVPTDCLATPAPLQFMVAPEGSPSNPAP